MKRALALSALLLVVLEGASATGRLGPQPELSHSLPLEYLPPNLQALVEQHEAAALPGEPAEHLQGLYEKLKRWRPGTTLQVCFFAGKPLLRSRIANAAREWTKHGNLKLEFGPSNAPYDCDSTRRYQIRIDFRYQGVWSMQGKGSVQLAAQAGPSMNFRGYHVAPPPEPEFSRQVLHEFGHALGFHHEHQNYEGDCESEFDWPELEKRLAFDPGWSPDQVRANIRRLNDDGRYQAVGGFDLASIMVYPLGAWAFRRGESSPCYVDEPNYVLSDQDEETMRSAYPDDVAVAEAERRDALKDLRAHVEKQSLGKDSRARSLEVLSMMARENVKARRVVEKLVEVTN